MLGSFHPRETLGPSASKSLSTRLIAARTSRSVDIPGAKPPVCQETVLRSRFEVLPKGGGVDEPRLLRSEEKRGISRAEMLAQFRKTLLVRVELLEVAPAKLLPFRGIVCVPPAQVGGRCSRSCPEIDPSDVFGETARPEAVDEDPAAIGATRGLVDTLRSDTQLVTPTGSAFSCAPCQAAAPRAWAM